MLLQSRSRDFLVGAGAGVKVQLRLHLIDKTDEILNGTGILFVRSHIY